jgi:hypothetical protein
MKSFYLSEPYYLFNNKMTSNLTHTRHVARVSTFILILFVVIACTPFHVQAQTITSFTLVNTETNQDIRTLANGETIDLTALQNGKLSIRANASSDTESVLFASSFKIRTAPPHEYEVEGLTVEQQRERKMQVERLRLENFVPYALFGATTEAPFNYTDGELAGGEITIRATPYTANFMGGTAGPSFSQTFIVTPFNATTFVLVNAETNEDIQEIIEGATIDLQTLPTRNLNVRANTTPMRVGSVTVTLQGVHVQPHENHFPYALFGKVTFTENYLPGTLPVGQHTLRAVPYGKPFGLNNETGNFAGGEATVAFTVVDGTLSANRGEIFNERLGFSLSAYPNPTPDRASIRFTVAKTEQVLVEVYDLKGSMVSRLFEQEARAGSEYQVILDADKLQSGVYVCRLKSGQYSAAHRILITK